MGREEGSASRRGERTGIGQTKSKGCKRFLLSAMTREFNVAGIVIYIRKL